jgi:hypothetical protein
MAEPAPGELRYKAFLSYSHKDAAIAARLHRKLEAYRLPRRLVGRVTPRGPVPPRLAPIFRDREEMAASTDLSETVRAALAESGALIVLCSPDAAASMWVAEEIATFRALHPGAPVLAAIVAGAPPDCFPEPLRTRGPDGAWHEPLATDLRRSGDGRHLGLLKLVAGLTGVGLDDLVQRDAHRRIRRVTAVTVAALAAMLIMAALTAVALGARQEADRQRAEAEGLIEFMLTDLRDRLKGVGRLDALTAVNERALRYYGRQEDLRRLPETALLTRSRILHAMGEDDLDRGNETAALTAFRAAHRTTAELLERRPGDPSRIFAHAQSEYWVGRVHELRREWAAAQRQFTRYADGAARLIGLESGNPDYMMEMGWGAQNLGAVQLNGTRDFDAAQRSFEEAARWFRRAGSVPSARQAAQQEEANALGWLADSFYARRMWRRSLTARLQQYRISKSLFVADPANVVRAFRLAISERAVAQTATHARAPALSRQFMRDAYARAQWLTTRERENAEWLLFRTLVECDLASASQETRGEIPLRELRMNIASAGNVLASQNNSRLSELTTCLVRVRQP